MKYAHQRIRQVGVTLIELMVVLVIGLVVSMAIMAIMSVSDGQKRTTTSTNDINQGGAFTVHELDKNIRSAGTGFSPILKYLPGSFIYGCKLHASKTGVQMLPATSDLPSPFDTIVSKLGAFRLIPIIIASGAAQGAPNSDILITMSGSGGYAQVPLQVSPPILSPNALPLKNSVSILPNDLLLVVDPYNPILFRSLCLLEQVNSTFVENAAPPIPLAGNFYTATGPDSVAADTQALVGYSVGTPVTATMLNLGQKPALKLFGVGSNYTLYSFDLLNSTRGLPVADEIVADGVFDMRALYGVVDAAGVLSWHAPTEVGYRATDLTTGTAAASATLQTIQAVRVGMILRSSLKEKVNATSGLPVSPTSVTLFSDFPGLSYTIDLTVFVPTDPDRRNYRYRTFEAIIPLRNLMVN